MRAEGEPERLRRRDDPSHRSNTLNKHTHDRWGVHVKILSSAVPPYIVSPVALQQIVLGQTVTISCQYNADANPIPTTYWYRGTRQVNDSRLTTVPGGLVITNVISTDEGNYTCYVISGVGSTSLVISAVFRGQRPLPGSERLYVCVTCMFLVLNSVIHPVCIQTRMSHLFTCLRISVQLCKELEQLSVIIATYKCRRLNKHTHPMLAAPGTS